MKALVIGGTRFFGKRLVNKLLENEVEVTLLNRGQHPDPFGKSVKRIKMDRAALDPEHPAIKNSSWDVVYDQICFTAGEAEAGCKVFRGKTERYVFTSSQSVYGPGADIPESAFDPFSYRFDKPVKSAEDYGEGKRQAEATFFQKSDFTIAAVRFPIVLGEDDYTGRLKFHVEKIALGEPIYFPNLDVKLSFIHAQDAAEFLFSLAELKIHGPINCCAFDPVHIRDFIGVIEKELGKKAIITNAIGAGEPSPFGPESDWYMNTDKLRRTKFEPRAILEWLPGLVSFFR